MASVFEKWVADIGGVKYLAYKLDVSNITVERWLSKESAPKLAIAKRIIDLSKGKLTLDDLVKGTCR